VKTKKEKAKLLVKKIPIAIGSLFLAAAIVYNSIFIYKRKPREDKTK
tara:strand:+ start:357 stop:497 length:141 start_codon:yes stop_codon:yes gene_type:complete